MYVIPADDIVIVSSRGGGVKGGPLCVALSTEVDRRNHYFNASVCINSLYRMPAHQNDNKVLDRPHFMHVHKPAFLAGLCTGLFW